MTHSKGPWWQSDKQPDAILTGDETASGRGPFRGENLSYYGGHLVAESIAPQNRTLISAAPDLLEALQAMYVIQRKGYTQFVAKQLGYEREFLVNGHAGFARAVRAKAEAAIAKATGHEAANG